MEQRLIVGIGNPGADYEYTRHNLGFLVLRKLAQKLEIKFGLSSLTNGLTAEKQDESSALCLLMPLTYVNKSGSAVKNVVQKRNVDAENILVICDDLNLDFSQIRIRPKGSDGGHNGLVSIIEKLQTEDFPRLRMGIGQPKAKSDTIDYVLEEFSKSEKKDLEAFIDDAVECAQVWLQEGVAKAMDQFNKRVNK